MTTEILLAVSFDATISLGAALVALLGGLYILSDSLIGRKRARGTIADLRSALADEEKQSQKFMALAQERDRELERKQTTIDTLGGTNVLAAVERVEAAADERTAAGMVKVVELFEGHERRAEERHRQLLVESREGRKQMLGVVDAVGHSLAELTKAVAELNNNRTEGV